MQYAEWIRCMRKKCDICCLITVIFVLTSTFIVILWLGAIELNATALIAASFPFVVVIVAYILRCVLCCCLYDIEALVTQRAASFGIDCSSKAGQRIRLFLWTLAFVMPLMLITISLTAVKSVGLYLFSAALWIGSLLGLYYRHSICADSCDRNVTRQRTTLSRPTEVRPRRRNIDASKITNWKRGFDGSVTIPNGPVGQGAEGVINKAMSEPAVEIELAPKDVVVGMPLDHVFHDDVPSNPPPSYEEGIFYIGAPDYNDVSIMSR